MVRHLGISSNDEHQHQHPLGDTTQDAAIYPIPLITAILRGMRDTEETERHDPEWPLDHADGERAEQLCTMTAAPVL